MKLGRISKLTLGSHQFFKKKRVDKKKITNIILKSLDNGINCIDTADSYGNGECEIFIGKLLKRKKLKEIRVATKFGQLNGFAVSKVQKNIDDSLKRLQKDQIDIYYFHSGSNSQFFNDGLWNIINKNFEKGKIKKIGLSIKTNYLKKSYFEQIKKCPEYNISVINMMFNPIIDNGKKIFNFCKLNNIEVTTRSPFLGGDIFKEKYKKETLSKLNLKSDDNYSSDIIKWIKKFKTIKSIVFGASNIDQLQSILKA